MRDLEELLRQMSQRPQSDTPPVGGFAELHRRLTAEDVPPVASVVRNWGSTVPILIAVLGLSLGWYHHVTAPSPSSVPIERITPSTLVPDVDPPVAELLAVPYSEPENQKSSTASRVAPAPTVLTATAQALERHASRVPSPIRPVPAPPVTRRTSPRLPRVTAPLSPAISVTPVVAAQLATISPRPPSKRLRAAGHWEVRLNAYPNMGAFDLYQNRYVEETSTSAVPMGFIQDGELRLLYYTASVIEQRRTARPVFQLHLNRRTRSGLYYGLGLTYYQNNEPGASLARSQTGRYEGSYVSYSDSKYNMLFGSLQLGYAFRLGRRWEPWIGTSLQVALRTERRSAYRLTDGQQDWTQMSSHRVNYPLFGSTSEPVLAGLELGIRYRVSPHWKTGLSLGMAPGDNARIRPTPGIDVLYSW